MYIYAVVCWRPVHAPCCQNTWRNKGFEKVRTHVAGVYLSKKTAQDVAAGMNKYAKEVKMFVKGYKVRDAQGITEYADNI